MEVEPETIAVNGNGHHDFIAIGPTVELVLGNGNGHAPAPVNGNGTNGHHDEAEEAQQSLFSPGRSSWSSRSSLRAAAARPSP